MTNFKYGESIKFIAYCPPSDTSEPNPPLLAYRLVSNIEPNDEDFLPPALLNPQRTFKTSRLKCSAYALSFFKNESQAKRHYKKLKKQVNEGFLERIKYIVETKIEQKDGLVSKPDRSGHFDLHEFTTSNVSGKSTFVCESEK